MVVVLVLFRDPRVTAQLKSPGVEAMGEESRRPEELEVGKQVRAHGLERQR